MLKICKYKVTTDFEVSNRKDMKWHTRVEFHSPMIKHTVKQFSKNDERNSVLSENYSGVLLKIIIRKNILNILSRKLNDETLIKIKNEGQWELTASLNISKYLPID